MKVADPMVRLVGVRCACGLETVEERLKRLGEPPLRSQFFPASHLRETWECDDCGEQAGFETAAVVGGDTE